MFCSDDSCNTPLGKTNRSGLCQYHRNKRNIEKYRADGKFKSYYVPRTGSDPRKGTVRHGNTPCSYKTAHQRVRNNRGHPSGYSCTSCSGVAQEWSYIGGAVDEQNGWSDSTKRTWVSWSPNPEHYQPMCIGCHRTYDGIKRLSTASSALIKFGKLLQEIGPFEIEKVAQMVADSDMTLNEKKQVLQSLGIELDVLDD